MKGEGEDPEGADPKKVSSREYQKVIGAKL